MTHTHANLDVSANVYDEVRALLLGVGYDHVLGTDGLGGAEILDMHGIALRKATCCLESFDPDCSIPVHSAAAPVMVDVADSPLVQAAEEQAAAGKTPAVHAWLDEPLRAPLPDDDWRSKSTGLHPPASLEAAAEQLRDYNQVDRELIIAEARRRAGGYESFTEFFGTPKVLDELAEIAADDSVTEADCPCKHDKCLAYYRGQGPAKWEWVDGDRRREKIACGLK